MEDEPGKLTIKVYGLEKSFILEFPSYEIKREWADSILKCVQYLRTARSANNDPSAPSILY